MAITLLCRPLCQRKIGRSFWPRSRIWRRCRRCRPPRGWKTCGTGCRLSPQVREPDCPLTADFLFAIHHQ